MAAPSSADIIAVAQQYSIPPAILLGVLQTQNVGTMGLPTATLGAYGMNAADLQSNPLLAIQLAARTLQQSFQQTGSWESALSQYLTGNPNAWQSPTASTGGDVLNILGQASQDPTFGLNGFTPADQGMFGTAANAFGTHLEDLVQLGGIVSQQTMRQYHSAVLGVQAYTGEQRFATSAQMHQIAEDILTAAKIPITDANVAVLSTMARGEGMPLGDFNWLATTSNAAPSVGTVNNTPGVKQYASYSDGIFATAQTLLNGNYNAMIALMRQGADLKTIASNPEVQGNLRKWQGGSNEDVSLLANTANVPGKQDPIAAPSEVGQFAAQLQGAGIDPRVFSQHFGTFATQRRRLLGSKRTDVSDFASMQSALAAKQRVIDEAGMAEHIREQPHGKYPDVTVGAFHDTFGRASLWGAQIARRFPTEAEAAHIVGMDERQMIAYFTNEAGQQPVAHPGSKSNIVPLPNQQAGQIKAEEQRTA